MNGPELFNGLDDALPLVLLPVRLVTRFHRPDPNSPPTELHLRIHPDVIHADGHDPTLTEQEELLGREYWSRVAQAHGDEAMVARRTQLARVPARSLPRAVGRGAVRPRRRHARR